MPKPPELAEEVVTEPEYGREYVSWDHQRARCRGIQNGMVELHDENLDTRFSFGLKRFWEFWRLDKEQKNEPKN